MMKPVGNLRPHNLCKGKFVHSGQITRFISSELSQIWEENTVFINCPELKMEALSLFILKAQMAIKERSLDN